MAKLKRITAYDLTTKEKGILSVLIGFAVSFNVLFFGMLYIYITNRIGFPVLLSEVLRAALTTSLPVWLAVSVVLFIVPKKLYSIFASLAVGGVIAAYVQGNILNSFAGLGALTGDAINWDDYRMFSLMTAGVWLLLILSPLAVRCFASTLIWKRTLLAVCALLSAMQGVALISSYFQNREGIQYVPQHYLSREGMYEVSSISNIFVFVIDAFDYDLVRMIRESEPSFFDKLDGFTEFTNAAAYYTNTFPSATLLTTGIPYDLALTQTEYFDYAWNNSEFIDTLKDAGYTMRYYMTDKGFVFTSYAQILHAADNIGDGRPIPLSRSVAWNFRTLSLYRFSPMLLKPYFWMPTVLFETTGHISDRERATQDDPLFFELLMENGLTLQDERPSYFYYHLLGSHPPHTMDEWGMYIGQSDSLSQTKGTLRIVFTYLDELKRLGVYDNSTILILADHGHHNAAIAAFSPHIAYFVKPGGSAGTPLAQSNAPISTFDNTIATILKSEGFDYSSFGKSAFDVEQDTLGERYFVSVFSNMRDYVEVFRIVGHIGDRNSLELIDILEMNVNAN